MCWQWMAGIWPNDLPMTPLRRQAIERVRGMVLAALAGHPASVYLFGSCARDTARHASDIDVAIEPHAPLPIGLLAALNEALEESTIPYDVEIVDLSTASETLRERVRREGVVWRT
jgi:uncharacterized protein